MKVVYRLSTVARLLELKNRSAKRTCGYRLVLNWNLRYAMRTCRGYTVGYRYTVGQCVALHHS